MDNTAYIMASKQISSIKNLDVVSNNVANVNTNGYKADKILFKELMVKDKHDKTSMNKEFATLPNFEGGTIKITGRELDLAISGDGFFVLKTPAGPRYTRDGAFQISKEGTLVNSKGYPVTSLNGEEIVFDAEDANPLIGEDGEVYIKNEQRGAVGIVEFDDLLSLRKVGNAMFATDIAASPAERSKVMQGSLEISNVNSINEIANMGVLQREVTESTHFINETYNMQKNAFRVFGKVGG